MLRNPHWPMSLILMLTQSLHLLPSLLSWIRLGTIAATLHCGPLKSPPELPAWRTLFPQIHSLCYNDCTFSLSTPTRLLEYNFLALANTISLAGGPSFTSKGLKYFHHFTLSLCGNQVSCVSAHGVLLKGATSGSEPETRTQEQSQKPGSRQMKKLQRF